MNQHTCRPGRVLRHFLVLFIAVGALSACGDNLFQGDNPPSLNEFAASAESVVEGDTIIFTVGASGPRTVDRIRVVLTGALVGDTTFAVDEPATDVSGEIALAVPFGTGPTGELTATAYAIDVLPDTSEPSVATVQITDATPPAVTGSVTPEQIGAGEMIQINVNAEDNRGIASVGAIVEDQDGNRYDPAPETIDPAELSVSHTFEIPGPGIDLGALSITPFAVDVNDFQSEAAPVEVSVEDRKGPTFIRLETDPDSTIPLLDSLQVTVELTDPAGIQRVTFVGLSYRGVPSQGTDEVVERFAQKTIEFPRPTEGGGLPTSYTLDPFLFTDDGDTTEPLEIFVIAEDSLGNVSDTTKMMYVGGPDVDLIHPPDGWEVNPGVDLDVQITIEDRSGIESVELILTGPEVTTPVIDLTADLPARTDTPFVLIRNVVLPDAAGPVDIQAQALNSAEVRGQSPVARVEVLSDAPPDTEAPTISVEAERLTAPTSDARMELLDEIRVTVSALDRNSGLSRVGMKAVASRAGVQHTIEEDVTFSGSHSLEQLVFQVPIDSLYARFGITDPAVLDSIMPEAIDLRIHGFAADVEENVACSVGIEEQRSCDPSSPYSPTEFYEASNHEGLLLRVEPVRGVTVLLDNRDARIADLAIDSVDDRLFLSNISQNLVEMLELDADFRQSAFVAPVQVGSEPWGMFLGDRVISDDEVGFGGITGAAGDIARTLVVSNSGGTNMSLVHLEANPDNVQEVDVVRLRTSNSVLLEIQEGTDDFGNIRYTVEFIDFADRPQYLAQDALLRIVYSTIPTDAEDVSTVRFVHVDPDPTAVTDEPEVRFLLTSAMVDDGSATSMVLANVDSILVRPIAGGSDEVKVFTHEPGYPDQVIVNTNWEPQIADAIIEVEAEIQAVMDARGIGEQAPMFFPFFMRGSWDLGAVSWNDETFISASGDRGRIAIGEGGASPTGRIMIWEGTPLPSFSDAIQMVDLVNNASEEVLGVGLNYDGSLGVARGQEATYFFTPDLRLQGLYNQEDVGGAGASFHPGHDEVTDGGHTDTDGHGVAFTGTSNHSIDVVNTFHFDRVNNLVIRDDIVGPLRAGPPLATDNNGQGGQCLALAATEAEEKDCIVVKLYAITSAGGVVILNVRRRDLPPYTNP